MIYIPNDGLDPAWNQAFEECAFELPTHDDLLLVWRNAPAVICGRYQNIFQEVHLPTAVAEGIHLVRRITGGGCVYHDPGNVNYALITDATQSGYDRPLCQMLEALRAIGVPAERSGSSALAIEGCKISGSAQRVSKGRLLHHGTLLFDANLQRLRRLANGHSACYTSKAIRSEPAPVGNIRDFLVDHTLDVETFCRRLIGALAPDETRPADFAAHATQLAEEKYRSWSWTFAPSPRFTFSRSCDFTATPCRSPTRRSKAFCGICASSAQDWTARASAPRWKGCGWSRNPSGTSWRHSFRISNGRHFCSTACFDQKG